MKTKFIGSFCKIIERKSTAFVRRCDDKYFTVKGIEATYINIDKDEKYIIFFLKRKKAPDSLYITKIEEADAE